MTLVDEMTKALIPYSNLTSPNCSDHVNRLRAQAVQDVVERRLLSDDAISAHCDKFSKPVKRPITDAAIEEHVKDSLTAAWEAVKGGDV